MKLLHGDCLDVLKELPDNSVDSIVTDPPYGLKFMGKKWDYDVPSVDVWRECLRVLKPGGHLLSFAGSRTYHRMTCAIEDAGFEVRDQIMWVYGCLDEATEVATANGVMPYHKTKIGDLVLCYNSSNGEYSYQPILEIVEYEYSDTAYRLIGDFGEQIVSRNHRVIVERDGSEAFMLAETLECEARVPFLEDLPALQQAIHDAHAGAGCAKQDMRASVLGGADWGEKRRSRLIGGPQGPDDNVRGMFKDCLEAGRLAAQGDDTDMQPKVQWGATRCGVGKTCSQGTGALVGRVGGGAEGAHDGRVQPGLEGRADVSQPEGRLRGSADQVRAMPLGSDGHGAGGRLCDGAPSCGGTGSRAAADASGVRASHQPRRDGQPVSEPDAVCHERTAQGIRAWGGHRSAVVRVVPFHYTGKVWCLRVPTGAFVAVRNGVAFPTGNSGFPKSLDVSKAIDKAAGVAFDAVPASGVGFMNAEGAGGYNVTKNQLVRKGDSTDAARQWQGWGTALKPAHEPVCVARKPLVGTVAENVLKHGTGALNIDGCRVGDEVTTTVRNGDSGGNGAYGRDERVFKRDNPPGRWPANLIHDGSDEVVAGFPVTGVSKSGVRDPNGSMGYHGGASGLPGVRSGHDDNGGSASRFFYCAKASKKDRNEGCQGVMTWENVDLQSAQMVVQQLQEATSDISILLQDGCEWSTTLFGHEQTARFLPAIKCIIEMATKQTTHSATSNCSVPLNTNDFIRAAIETMKACGSSPAVFAEYTNPSKLNTTCEKTESAAAAVHAVFKMLCDANESAKVGNVHSTVKPTDLMRYLCRLVTPPGGVVLDPFMGSGSTGKAAVLEGFRFIGIEREAEYLEIAQARIQRAG